VGARALTGGYALFDGRDYNQQFNEACSTLAFEQDEDEIREKLCSIEWVLAEAIRGAFLVAAILQSGLLLLPIGWVLDVRNMDWTAQAIFFALLVSYATVSYWISRFAFWHEVSRHVRPRRFGQ
jgi:hypothetical protein